MQTETVSQSMDVREDFLAVLANLGGVCTVSQAHAILEILGEHRLPGHKYRPEVYLLPESRSKRITIDRDHNLMLM